METIWTLNILSVFWPAEHRQPLHPQVVAVVLGADTKGFIGGSRGFQGGCWWFGSCWGIRSILKQWLHSGCLALLLKPLCGFWMVPVDFQVWASVGMDTSWTLLVKFKSSFFTLFRWLLHSLFQDLVTPSLSRKLPQLHLMLQFLLIYSMFQQSAKVVQDGRLGGLWPCGWSAFEKGQDCHSAGFENGHVAQDTWRPSRHRKVQKEGERVGCVKHARNTEASRAKSLWW